MRALCFSYHETPYLSRFRVVKSGIYLLYCDVSLAPAGSILYPPYQLTTGGVDIITAGCSYGGHVAAFIQNGLEPPRCVHAWPSEITFRERIERNQVNLARQAFQQGHQLPGMFRLVIAAFNNLVFNGRFAFIRQTRQIPLRCCQKLRDRLLFIQWNESVAEFLLGCMQRVG